MSRFSSRNSAGTGCKVYIGGLTQNASKDEIEEAFERYGRLRSVFVARNPPGFAFVEFGDPYDAEDSVKALDGRLICGSRVKVEISHGRSRPKNFVRILKEYFLLIFYTTVTKSSLVKVKCPCKRIRRKKFRTKIFGEKDKLKLFIAYAFINWVLVFFLVLKFFFYLDSKLSTICKESVNSQAFACV